MVRTRSQGFGVGWQGPGPWQQFDGGWQGFGRGSLPFWGSLPGLGKVSPPACPTGRDATRAFATGDFTQAGLVDDVSALSSGEMLAIQSWLTFYSDNYDPVGRWFWLRQPHARDTGWEESREGQGQACSMAWPAEHRDSSTMYSPR